MGNPTEADLSVGSGIPRVLSRRLSDTPGGS